MPGNTKKLIVEFVPWIAVAIIAIIAITGIAYVGITTDDVDRANVVVSGALAMIAVATLILSFYYNYLTLELNEKTLKQMKNAIFIEKEIEYILELFDTLNSLVEKEKRIIALYEKIHKKDYSDFSEMKKDFKRIHRKLGSLIKTVNDFDREYTKYFSFIESPVSDACKKLFITIKNTDSWISDIVEKMVDSANKVERGEDRTVVIKDDISPEDNNKNMIKIIKRWCIVDLKETETIKTELDNSLAETLVEISVFIRSKKE